MKTWNEIYQNLCEIASSTWESPLRDAGVPPPQSNSTTSAPTPSAPWSGAVSSSVSYVRPGLMLRTSKTKLSTSGIAWMLSRNKLKVTSRNQTIQVERNALRAMSIEWMTKMSSTQDVSLTSPTRNDGVQTNGDHEIDVDITIQENIE